MKRRILYKSIDPYYSDFEIAFIGIDEKDIDGQIYEFNQYVGREHPSGISTIYKPKIMTDSSLEHKLDLSGNERD